LISNLDFTGTENPTPHAEWYEESQRIRAETTVKILRHQTKVYAVKTILSFR